MLPRACLCLSIVFVLLGPPSQAQGGTLLREDFESYAAPSLLDGQGGWTGYDGTEHATATVVAGAGVDGSQGLAIAALDGTFRSDSYGLRREVEAPQGGVYWVSLRYRPPSATDWLAGLCFRLGHTEVNATDDEAWATWENDWWRIHRAIEMAPGRWYTLTLRVDADRAVYSAWLDDVRLGEGLPLLNQGTGDLLYLGGAGTEDAPLLIDDLSVSQTQPSGLQDQPLLPQPGPGHLFRFAALGDPQPGMNDYDQNLAQLRVAVDQIRASGAALSVALGDMVHNADDEQAYADVRDALDDLDTDWHTVRGNHDRRDHYRTYFKPDLDYAFVHEGVRFVVLDAVGEGDVDPPSGTYEGLTEAQLAWVQDELAAARAADEEVVLVTHVSPWQDNPMGAGSYYQIGTGRDTLVDLIEGYGVSLVLSGHYHKALWHHEENGTDYLVVAGTAIAREGALDWALIDVYPDRFEVYNKPLFAAYDEADVEDFYNSATAEWRSFAEQRLLTPDIAWGPITIQRHHPVATAQEPTTTASGFALEQSRPNPARDTAEIAFTLPAAGPARLAVYDVLGREVAVLVDGDLPGGPHVARWARSGLPSGVYVYRLTAGRHDATRRMVLSDGAR